MSSEEITKEGGCRARNVGDNASWIEGAQRNLLASYRESSSDRAVDGEVSAQL